MQNEIQEQDNTSRLNHLKLVRTGIDGFAGLNYESGALLVVFNDHKIIEASGDQGAGKTSFMNAIKSLLGEELPKNAINSKTGAKGLFQDFIVDGVKYRTKFTTKSLTLHTVTEVKGEEILGKLDNPLTRLRNLIGPVGVDPTFLRGKKPGAEQLEWIKSLMKTEASAALESDIKIKYQKSYDERKKVNADWDTLKQELTANQLYTWDTINKVMHPTAKLEEMALSVSKAPGQENIKEEFSKWDKLRLELSNATNGLSNLKTQEEKLVAEIEELKLQLKGKEAALVSKREYIQKGEKYIADAKDVEANYAIAKANMENSSKIALDKLAVEEAKSKFTLFQQKDQAKFSFNVAIEGFIDGLTQIAAMFTPPIEGLEIVTTSIDNTKKPEGVYLNGINIAFLSESELWDFCLQIWKLQGVSVVFIENTTSLGTEAISRINWFAEKGGYCFLSTMQRDYKELKISFLKEVK